LSLPDAFGEAMKKANQQEKQQGRYPVVFLCSRHHRSMGRMIIYDYYHCEDACGAEDFLKRANQPLPFHYIIVVTPNGKWGRDADGVYRVSG
jgi:hypothetical protein